jgi:hypothetical protein
MEISRIRVGIPRIMRDPEHAGCVNMGAQTESPPLLNRALATATSPHRPDRPPNPIVEILLLLLIVKCIDEEATEKLSSVERKYLPDRVG